MKFKGMEKVGDLLLLNLMFVLSSLPVVTVGAAAAAMHYVLRRLKAGEGTVIRDFIHAFRQNFRQATFLFLGFLLGAALIGLNLWLSSGWTGPVYWTVTVCLLIGGYFLLVWASVVFPFLARFDNTTWKIAKNAAVLAFVCPLRGFAAAVINVIPVAFAVLLPDLFSIAWVLWAFFFCAASGWLVQRIFAPVFDRLGTKDQEEA